ncbi:hypothetical protein PENANT_c004G11189 [Penicillium antarcticum]|uniref:Uncharacterized protein n=1 Tax=Penicillium antarcticum TaxID=416450 RepID=A0A1V6QG11_9EURO|nr:uncharacterized protein N7508_002514 [Penicillium antarcticum]KAJ5318006.1 hypothetical protein N7508_002514 [Penicillium antarcticum]OQD88153.1 hypothetical protein PENANT_c004G11189 [Penicillium antarcticum]
MDWYRWEEPIPVADSWTAQEARNLLNRQIDFAQYPFYYPVTCSDFNLDSFPPSPVQRWGLIPVNVLVNDEFVRRKMETSFTAEQYEVPDENDSLAWGQDMHKFLNEQRSLPE